MNVFALFANAALASRDRTAIRYGGLRQSYGELADSAAALSAHLAALGLQRGDRVAIYMRNNFGYPTALLGALRGGYVVVPINAKLHPREAAFIVENAEARAVVLDCDAVAAFGARYTGPSLATLAVRGAEFVDAAGAAATRKAVGAAPPAEAAPEESPSGLSPRF
jgi:long-chain acyl-CoA synthetase